METETTIPETKRFLQVGINNYVECQLCAKELPPGVSMAADSGLEAGFTTKGFQVACHRHGINVLHFDFQGVVQRASGNADKEDFEFAAVIAPLTQQVTFNAVAAGLSVARARIKTFPSVRPARDVS